MVVDLGTTITMLRLDVYEPLMAALKAGLTKHESVKINNTMFEFSFNSTTGFEESLVPKLTFYFEKGGEFAPPLKSYVV